MNKSFTYRALLVSLMVSAHFLSAQSEPQVSSHCREAMRDLLNFSIPFQNASPEQVSEFNARNKRLDTQCTLEEQAIEFADQFGARMAESGKINANEVKPLLFALQAIERDLGEICKGMEIKQAHYAVIWQFTATPACKAKVHEFTAAYSALRSHLRVYMVANRALFLHEQKNLPFKDSILKAMVKASSLLENAETIFG